LDDEENVTMKYKYWITDNGCLPHENKAPLQAFQLNVQSKEELLPTNIGPHSKPKFVEPDFYKKCNNNVLTSSIDAQQNQMKTVEYAWWLKWNEKGAAPKI
jgi:hypothetical protein